MLEPSNTDWLLASGERSVTAPAENYSVADLPVATIDPNSARFTVDSSVIPAQAEVTVFDTIDPEGVPQGQGRNFDCNDAVACKLIPSIEHDTLEIVITPAQGSKVMVLHLYYLVENDHAPSRDQPIETNYASYPVRII